ncbi:MAG: extracellular solute-binding protein, partial [SAR324 cluster bacterium]|nr:extracellular solute-binding protein [SAR324 cluster bacterium]
MKTMKIIKRVSLLSAGLLLLAGLFQIQAQELKFIMCGGEVRAADQKVIDAFQASNPGVKVNMEAVPWGTCQDKSMTLAAAGDPVSLAYMGSRTLKRLGKNNLIVPVTIPEKDQGKYQPGILKTV